MKFPLVICYILLARSNEAAAARNALRHEGTAVGEKEPGTDVEVTKQGTAVVEPITSMANDEAVNVATIDGTTDSAAANSAIDRTADENGLDTNGSVGTDLLAGINTSKDKISNDIRNLRGQRELVWYGGPGCPQSYTQKSYFPGELASYNGGVYQCASSPTNLFCGMTGYRPEVDYHWNSAWTALGTCTPGISVPAPTPVRSIPTGPHLGGCPGVWQHGIHTLYKEGDRVSKDGKVFRCKAYPFSGHCSQQGYEPETNPATPGAWMDAWELIGYCEGVIRDAFPSPTPMPTKSPTKSPICHTPTPLPTKSPTCHTVTPTTPPPSPAPTIRPTNPPTDQPTPMPTKSPTKSPICPTPPPTQEPTLSPSDSPSNQPSKSKQPSGSPSMTPSTKPSTSKQPSVSPSMTPSTKPSLAPSESPSMTPSTKPSIAPSDSPSLTPSTKPSMKPSQMPSNKPSLAPSESPSKSPTIS